MNNTTHPDYGLRGVDLFLAIAGLIGIVLFGVFLPSEHPDSTAAYEIEESEAVDFASNFLSRQGLSVEGLTVDARFRRRSSLLENIQSSLGRNEAVRFLDSEAGQQLAGYYWDVTFYLPGDPDEEDFLQDSDQIFNVGLSQSGALISFQDDSGSIEGAASRFGSTRTHVHRRALTSLFNPDSSSFRRIRRSLAGMPDSVFSQNLYFNMDLARHIPPDSLLFLLESSQPTPLDSTFLKQLVSFHMARTAFAKMDWLVDSVQVNLTSGRPIARVDLHSRTPVAGQEIAVTTTLSATGALSGMALSQSPVTKAEMRVTDVLTVIAGGLLTLLSLVFIVVFFRRMMARLLDMKSALLDAMMLGILVGVIAVLATSDITQAIASAPVWATILFTLLLFSFTAGGVAVFAFILAGVVDSVVREHHSGKLRTFILLRRGDVQNKPMGASLLRGASVAGVILGISVIALGVFPDLGLKMDNELLGDSSIRPFVSALFSSFTLAYFYVLLWMVGVTTTAFKWSKKPLFAILIAVATGSVLAIGPFPMNGGYAALVASATFALVLALAYVRFDIVTVIVAIFLSKLVWSVSEGFLISGSTSWVDLLLAVLFVVLVLGLGILGVISNKEGQQADTYVPAYVTEMAAQERVKRELEIAQQVQTFFLPRAMPSIAGLEIASMCLPATEVGGDYYDFIELDNGKLAFILGDVSGKGIQAAFFMTLVKGIVQTLSRQGLSCSEVMRRLNHLFCLNAPAGTFISVIYGEFNPKERSFTFSRAGHNPAILYESALGQARALQPKGMAIGFSDGHRFDSNIDQVEVNLSEGDSMVFYTDGFSEAMNRKRDLYGDDRLLDKVSQLGDRSAPALLRMLSEDVHHFIEGTGRTDDMTMVVFKLIQAGTDDV